MASWLAYGSLGSPCTTPGPASQGRRQQTLAAPSGELVVLGPELESISGPIVLESLLATLASSERNAPTVFRIEPIHPTGEGTLEDQHSVMRGKKRLG